MSKAKLHLSLGLLVCLAATPAMSQNRRSGGGSDAGTQRREAPSSSPSSSGSSSSNSRQEGPRERYQSPSPSSSSNSSDRTPSNPRSTYERPTERPVPQAQPTREPSRTSDSDTQRRDRYQSPSPSNSSDRTPVNPRSNQGSNPRSSVDPDAQRRVINRERNREGSASPTIRRDGNYTAEVNRGVPETHRTVYGSAQYHNPYGHSSSHHFDERECRHRPYTVEYHHRIVLLPNVYYNHLYTHASACYYYDWLFCYTSRSNGYFIIDDYPFYVYNGYYHRYSNYDSCNYQLIDSYTRRVVKSYWGLSCRSAYDECANTRDYLNIREYNYRFDCAETYRPQNYQYFNSFNENDYRVGGYNSSTSDDYYENDYIAPNVDSRQNQSYEDQNYENRNGNSSMIPSSSTNSGASSTPLTPSEEVSDVEPALGSVSGSMTELPSLPSQSHNNDTQDY